jgi:hypothetical protein
MMNRASFPLQRARADESIGRANAAGTGPPHMVYSVH